MARKSVRKVETFTPEVEEELEEALEDAEQSITDNALAVPLFADIDGRTSRSISQLRLSKLEGGGIAYKGMIPLSSTLDTIGQIFGDGIYMLEGLNHRGTVLHSKENVRISLAGNEPSNGNGKALAYAPNAEIERIERLSRQSANESVQNSRDFLQLIITTTQAQQERDRQFFTSMMTMQDKQYQQTIAMMQLSHNATIQTMQVNRENNQPQTDQNDLLETLIRGMNMGREMGAGIEPAPAWQSILQGGLGALAQVNQQNPQLLANGKAAGPKKKALSPAHKRTLLEAVRLHRAVRSSGVDVRDMIAQLSKVGESAELEATPTLSDAMHADRTQLAGGAPGPNEDTEIDEDDDVLEDDESEDDLDLDDEDESDPDESGESASAGAAD